MHYSPPALTEMIQKCDQCYFCPICGRGPIIQDPLELQYHCLLNYLPQKEKVGDWAKIVQNDRAQ